MSTPLTQMPKPDSEQYKESRKLFLVPTFLMSPDLPEDGQEALGRYWAEVREHVQNLERSLGSVSHVYHEAVHEEGEQGLRIVESVNPHGYSFIQVLCQSTAQLEATDDIALLQEATDWQRCISLGLMSVKVMTTAVEGFREATDRRYEHIASRIQDTMKEEEAGVLFIREDHKVQFPPDIQVFYVAPPALDALKRWMNDQARAFSERMQQSPPDEEPQQEEETGEAEETA